MPRIEAKVSQGGRILLNFVGFDQSGCFREAETLIEALGHLGLDTRPLAIRAKMSEEIREEMGVKEGLGIETE